MSKLRWIVLWTNRTWSKNKTTYRRQEMMSCWWQWRGGNLQVHLADWSECLGRTRVRLVYDGTTKQALAILTEVISSNKRLITKYVENCCFTSQTLRMRSSGMIPIKVDDPRSLGSWCIKVTDESWSEWFHQFWCTMIRVPLGHW